MLLAGVALGGVGAPHGGAAALAATGHTGGSVPATAGATPMPAGAVVLRRAQAEILRLTGLLSQARRRADAPSARAAAAALTEARTAYALVVRDLSRSGEGASGAVLDRARESMAAADRLAARGESLLAEAPATMHPPASDAADAGRAAIQAPSIPSVPAPPPGHLPPPDVPAVADLRTGAAPAPAPASPADSAPPFQTPAPVATPDPGPLIPATPPPAVTAVSPEPAPSPARAAVAPEPDVPAPPPGASPTAPGAVGRAELSGIDAPPPGTVTIRTPVSDPAAGSAAALAGDIAGTLPPRAVVEMTGDAALPPPGGRTGPFRAGGPADWTPDTTPVARPGAVASVVVNRDEAPPPRPYPPAGDAPSWSGPVTLPRMDAPAVPAPPPGAPTGSPGLTAPPPSLTTATAEAPAPGAVPDPSPRVDRPTLPDDRLLAYAGQYPLRRRSLQLPPPGAALPRPSPGLALDRPPGLASERPAGLRPSEQALAPPPAPAGMAPSPVPARATVAGAAAAPAAADTATAPPPPPGSLSAPSRPPAALRTASVNAAESAPLSSEDRAQFAEIKSQIAAQRDQARDILRQIDPVRTDLTRRMQGLAPGDARRAGMTEVREIINGAEVDLKAALDGYGALSRQLDFVLEGDGARGGSWTPADAARQAVSASKRANAGVNGLKTAMARFEQVMSNAR